MVNMIFKVETIDTNSSENRINKLKLINSKYKILLVIN